MPARRPRIDLIVTAIGLATTIVVSIISITRGNEATVLLERCREQLLACDVSTLGLATSMLLWGGWLVLITTVGFVIALFASGQRTAWFSVLAAGVAIAFISLAAWLANASVLIDIEVP